MLVPSTGGGAVGRATTLPALRAFGWTSTLAKGSYIEINRKPRAQCSLSATSCNCPCRCSSRSGNGLHVYWPLDRLLSPDEWRAGALRLKLACKAHGLNADESRTTDISSILRPPGTHNRKVPHAPRLVEVGQLVGPYDADAFVDRLGNGASPTAPDHGRRISDTLLNYSPPAYSEAEEARLRSALSFIPADDYQNWRNVGMGLHSTEWGEPARRLWDEWSRSLADQIQR